MNSYQVRVQSQDLTIEGDTLEAAVTTNFKRLAQAGRLGNAAGYRLTRAVLSPGPPNAKSGGDPFTLLTVEAVGLNLAHMPVSQTPTQTIFYIRGRHIEQRTELAITQD